MLLEGGKKRIKLHFLCMLKDKHIVWHIRGIFRELMFTFLFCMIFLGATKCYAVEINLDKIAQIESSNIKYAMRTYCGKSAYFFDYKNAINYYNNNKNNIESIGKYQISKICLADYNKFNKKIKAIELFNPETNKKVANWYFNKRIPQLLKHYGIKDTKTNRLIAYNAGVKSLKDKGCTKKYMEYVIKYNN